MNATDTNMRAQHGAGPNGARCESCIHLAPIQSNPRPSERARNHQPLTLFRCLRADGSPWSVQYGACGLFRRVA